MNGFTCPVILIASVPSLRHPDSRMSGVRHSRQRCRVVTDVSTWIGAHDKRNCSFGRSSMNPRRPVIAGAKLSCTFGIGDAVLTPTPIPPMDAPGGIHLATVMDCVPLVNIPAFPLCNAKTNPTVIMATAAAFGTPTPAACSPVIEDTWHPPSILIAKGGVPALTPLSTCRCKYFGIIRITDPGQGPFET